MAYFLIPDAIFLKFGPFLRNSTRVCDLRTDGRTHALSYRDARTHLKITKKKTQDITKTVDVALTDAAGTWIRDKKMSSVFASRTQRFGVRSQEARA